MDEPIEQQLAEVAAKASQCTACRLAQTRTTWCSAKATRARRWCWSARDRANRKTPQGAPLWDARGNC